MRARDIAMCRRAGQAGQTATEFAMVATIFLLVIFAIMEMALVVYAYNTVSYAACQATRYAIVHGPKSPDPASTADIQQIAINNATDLDSSNLTVNVSFPADAKLPSRDDAEVQVTYNYKLQIPFLSSKSLDLTSTSRMLMSNDSSS